MRSVFLLLFLSSYLFGCGVAFIHLGEEATVGDQWALEKLLLLMQKQQNRGRDGAGIAVLSARDIQLHKQAGKGALVRLQGDIAENLSDLHGHSFLGHIRYATYAGLSLAHCQPLVSGSTEFALAGNFNMTNIAALSNEDDSIDTAVILRMLEEKKESSWVEGIGEVANRCDGGYFFVVACRDGSFFLFRDPHAIRPGHYVHKEGIFAAASERSALLDSFDLSAEDVYEVPPGTVLYCSPEGTLVSHRFAKEAEARACVFERIYFSKGRDREIYQERKELGRVLAKRVYEAIDGDLENTVFTYVPNTSLLSFQGLTEEMAQIAHEKAIEDLLMQYGEEGVPKEALRELACPHVRREHLIKKKSEKRTFITADNKRKELISKIYEVSKAVVTPNDTLVVVEDSIVRGNTLKHSVIAKLFELNPKKIIIVSSAPPIYYPDCYGIDMSQIDRLVAFQALVALLQEQGLMGQLESSEQLSACYALFSLEEISAKIAQLLVPESYRHLQERVEVIYQSVADLRRAIPSYRGDWYFSGAYPTPGGFAVLRTSFLNWKAGREERAY